MTDIETLLSGAAMGALFTGFLGMVSAFVSDRRGQRYKREIRLSEAYEGWAACLEDARACALHHAITSQEEPNRDRQEKLFARSTELASRMGAAETKLLLLEPDANTRRRISDANTAMAGALLYAGHDAVTDNETSRQRMNEGSRKFALLIEDIAIARQAAWKPEETWRPSWLQRTTRPPVQAPVPPTAPPRQRVGDVPSDAMPSAELDAEAADEGGDVKKHHHS